MSNYQDFLYHRGRMEDSLGLYLIERVEKGATWSDLIVNTGPLYDGTGPQALGIGKGTDASARSLIELCSAPRQRRVAAIAKLRETGMPAI